MEELRYFKQFVPSLVCLNCEGCCRFPTADSVWRPRLCKRECRELESLTGIEGMDTLADDKGFIETKFSEGAHVCRFLEPLDNTCYVYEARPLECRLYPFMLVKREDKVFLCLHLACPFVQEHQDTPVYDAYVEYLREVFAEPFLKGILEKSPEMVGAYPDADDEFVTVFEIERKA